MQPPTSRHRSILWLAILLATTGALTAGEEIPYGHADFYPTPERPAQLRGDGTGYFPGSEAVDSFDFRTGENIVWACPLPGWGFSSPIVVGDKAFVTCDWNKLVCVDVRTGTVLWAKDNHTFDLVGGDKADELREIFDQLTIPWLEAHQTLFERSYLEREIDLIEAARAGEPLKPRQAMRKGKMRDRDNWGGHCPGDHLTEAEKAMLLEQAKSVDDATLAALKERYEALRAKCKEQQLGPQTSGYIPTLCPYARHSENEEAFEKSTLPCGKTVKDAFKYLQRHGIVFEIWNGWLGRSYSTPASDGDHVFAQFGQSQVVCYDLAGERQWLTVIPDVNPGNRRQNDSASLILADDKVIVLMGGSDGSASTFLQALDKRTGQILWQTPLKYHRTSHSFPNQTRVKHGEIDAIATSGGAIVRTSDGKIIMQDLPAPIAPPLVVGNQVFLTCGYGQSNGQGSRMKISLNREGDEIVGTIDWAFLYPKGKGSEWYAAAKAFAPDLEIAEPAKKEPHSNVAPLLIDGLLVNHGGTYDAATGVMKQHFGRFKGPSGNLIRTGNDLIIAPAGDRPTLIYDAQNLGKPKSCDVGSEWHRRIQLGKITLEEATENVVELPWLPHTQGQFGGQTTIWPQGDRFYLRTHDTLYCIGDPEASYHSPASAPAAARTGE